MNDEIRLNKALDPKGHEVSYTHEGYWCETCMTSYDEQELQFIPIDRSGFKPLHPPSVYGHPN